MAPFVGANPPSDGDSATIDANMVWSEDGTFDGHVTVLNGATLTISADIAVETGSSITIEEGGQLVITNGGLLSSDLNAGRMVNTVYSTLTLNFGDLAEEGVVQLKFNHEISSDAKMDVIFGETTVNASGFDMVQFDVPLTGENLTFTFDSYYFTPTYVLSAKAIHSGGDTSTLLAQDMEAENAPLYWFQSAYDIIAYGQVSLNHATLEGANLECHALCQFEDATLTGSAPVIVNPASSFSIVDSVISGSRTDEDIIVMEQAEITYENTQGTGGTTDAWIRLLSQRSLTTNIPNGSLDITGMGWSRSNWNDLTDENGNIVLVSEGETNEHKRIVEWRDGEGVVHHEDATITLSITSSWGTFSTTIDAPTTSSATIEVALPFIKVTEVAPENTNAVANKSISGLITVENTGDVAASGVSVWCYEGDEVADTTQITVSLLAGESKQVPFTWYAYEAGEVALTCTPLLPTALDGIADLVVDATGANSPTVTWTYAEDVEQTPFLIWLIAALGFAGLAFFASAQARKQKASGSNEVATSESGRVEQEEKTYTEEI